MGSETSKHFNTFTLGYIDMIMQHAHGWVREPTSNPIEYIYNHPSRERIVIMGEPHRIISYNALVGIGTALRKAREGHQSTNS